MIQTETIVLDGRTLIHTYSDEGRFVVRDGVSYDEAYDPAELGRTYIEGDLIPQDEEEPEEEPTAEEILNILLGGEGA